MRLQSRAPTTQMIHEPFASLESMLSADAMSVVEGRAVSSVTRRRWTPPAMIVSVSGSQFLKVETSAPDGDRRLYVVKRIAPHQDLIMRLTCDEGCRERLVWQHGLLDDLPHEVSSPIVASAVDGDGWALLMLDVTEGLVVTTNWRDGGWVPLNSGRALSAIGALAVLHAHFWESESLRNPALALCTSRQLYTSLGPPAAQREAAGGEWILAKIREGWALLEQLVPGDVARAIRELQVDPQPLLDALARYPWTLRHGDVRADNVALSRDAGPRLTLLDWQCVGTSPPAVDLMWFVIGSWDVLPLTQEAAIDHYRSELARLLGTRFDQTWWQSQLELAMLGQFLRCAWWLMFELAAEVEPGRQRKYRVQLDWLTEGVRLGLKCL